MITSNCPRCQEGFRVPIGTMPDGAYAMCPWCHETFPLAEVLDRLPPQLQILTADGEPIIVMEPAGLRAAVAGPSSFENNTAAGFHPMGAGEADHSTICRATTKLPVAVNGIPPH